MTEETDEVKAQVFDELDKGLAEKQAMAQQLMSLAADHKVSAVFSNNVSACVTSDGEMLRLTFGEVFHPSVPPSQHVAVVLPWKVATALAEIITNVHEQFEAQKAARSSASEAIPTANE